MCITVILPPSDKNLCGVCSFNQEIMKLLFSDSIRNVLAYTYAGLHETAANPC